MLDAAGEASEHCLEAFAFSVFYLYQLNSILLWWCPISGFVYRNDGITFGLVVTVFDIVFKDV